MTKIKSEKKIKIKKIKNTVLLSTHIMEQGGSPFLVTTIGRRNCMIIPLCNVFRLCLDDIVILSSLRCYNLPIIKHMCFPLTVV
jgi:hypothetical protein